MANRPRWVRRTAHRRRDRRGATMFLVLLLVVLFVVGMIFSVDVAYMQLTRTELHVATDSAAKAAAVSLAQGNNAADAIDTAVRLAQLNSVDSRGLKINASHVELGTISSGANGAWDFTPGGDPATAARVSVSMTPGSDSGQVNLFFAKFLGSGGFSPQMTSTAGFSELVVELVLDRSGSMNWDLSGVDGVFPPGGKSSKPPVPGSRWVTLSNAVKLYIDLIDAKNKAPSSVGIVTWASDYDVDVAITKNTGLLRSAMTSLGNQVISGRTNLSQGMQVGLAELQNYKPKVPVNKMMIVMTDGQWNEGIDPLIVAADCQKAGIKVHTIGLLVGSMQATLEQIASMTGGRNFMAQDEAELINAFEELAKEVPVVLTQ